MIRKLKSGEYRLYSRKENPKITNAPFSSSSAAASGRRVVSRSGMNDVEVAVAVAQAGATVVRRRFGAGLQRFDKDAGDFATDADIEAEKAMLAVLHRERPEDAVLGEESGHGGASGARRWLLDPLCGTLNYAAGTRVAAVNVALAASGECRIAAVADPFSEEVVWTDGASVCVRAGGLDRPAARDARSTLVDLNFDPPFPNAPTFKTVTLAGDSAFVEAFKPRVLSTSMALVWVATGQRAAYVTDGDPRDSVHFAAGIAICRAAGCVVTDLWGRACGGPTGLLAAADAATHRTLLGLVRKYLV